jgi:alpha-1,3-glucosyltransferase
MNLNTINSFYLFFLVQSFSGLILVDNMHFQYNTILFSIFFFSLHAIFSNNFLTGAILFSILLNMKHIFLYMAPAYFVFYIKYYVLRNNQFSIFNFIKLAFSILFVFVTTFSPFI